VFAKPAFTDQEKMAAGIEFVPRTEGNAYAEFVPRNEGTAYAEPLGYRGVNTLEDLADRELFGVRFCSHQKRAFLLWSIVSTKAWSAWMSPQGKKSAAPEPDEEETAGGLGDLAVM